MLVRRKGRLLLIPSLQRNLGLTGWRLQLQSKPQGVGLSFASHPIEEFASSSVTPTLEPDIPEDYGSTQDAAVQTHRASMRIVVSSSSGHNDDDAALRAEPHVGVEDIAMGSTWGGGLARLLFLGTMLRLLLSRVIPILLLTTSLILRLLIPLQLRMSMFRNEVLPMAALHNQSNADFLDSFNVNFAQHQRDAEIAALKIKLEKAKSEATEVVVLCGRVSELEAGAVARSEEVNTLNKQNAELLGKVSTLESGRGELNKHIIRLGVDCERLRNEVAGKPRLREEFKSIRDAKARCFEEKSAQLDARIADVRRDMDDDLYPHMFISIARRRWVLGHDLRLAVRKCTQSAKCRSVLGRFISLAIDNGIQEGLEARIKHGKFERSLAQVEAYNPEVKDRYVAAVTDFKNVSFTLLDELESLKDSPLASIISALVLKDDQGNVIPAVCVATERKGLCRPSGSMTGVVAVSAPLQDSSFGVGDYQVSTFTLADDGVAHPPPVTV
ncbi:hypothetical protein Tco_0163056 [Tanacetum coccineum]